MRSTPVNKELLTGVLRSITSSFIFLRKKGDFSDVFSAFYGQRLVTAAWATRSPWSIFLRFLLLTHFRETPMCEIIPPQYFEAKERKA